MGGNSSKFQEYIIIRLLGKGIDDRVYEVSTKSNKKRYALKIIEIKTTDQYNSAKNFHNIGLKLKKLNHPNILTIYHIDFRDEIDYYGNID